MNDFNFNYARCEDQFGTLLKQKTKNQIIWAVIEGTRSVPDRFYSLETKVNNELLRGHGWVELKYIRHYPHDGTLRFTRFTLGQRKWLQKHSMRGVATTTLVWASGRVFALDSLGLKLTKGDRYSHQITDHDVELVSLGELYMYLSTRRMEFF